ncbi:unnamed protein product [Soboliphyme baturini]|uniref:PITH domain-containing protein n=1 Tax=Soboliphyme baturini TaxID=241478 RepID=A0A183J8E8_9BILA|nr:unnamed protein product [Soboliphyme baturini]
MSGSVQKERLDFPGQTLDRYFVADVRRLPGCKCEPLSRHLESFQIICDGNDCIEILKFITYVLNKSVVYFSAHYEVSEEPQRSMGHYAGENLKVHVLFSSKPFQPLLISYLSVERGRKEQVVVQNDEDSFNDGPFSGDLGTSPKTTMGDRSELT